MNDDKKKWYDNINGQTIAGATGFIGSAIDQFGRQKSANEILADSGTTTSYGPGFSFQRINPIDYTGQLREQSGKALSNTLNMAGQGSAIGSAFGPIGSAVGGAVGLIAGGIGSIFGRNSLKRQLERAAQRQIAYNGASMAGGMTTYLQQNEDPSINTGILYAYRGKDRGQNTPLYKNGKDMIHTSVGKMSGTPNAMGDYGESILDNIDNYKYATGHIINERPTQRDANPVKVQDDTVILGNDVNWNTGKTFKSEAAPYTKQLEAINKKFSKKSISNNFMRGQLGQKTDELQDLQVAKLKKPIVDKLNQLAEQQKSQHNIMRKYYNFDPHSYMPQYAGGKNKENEENVDYPPDRLKNLISRYSPEWTDWAAIAYSDNPPKPTISRKDPYLPDLKKVPKRVKFIQDARIDKIPAIDTWVYNTPAMLGGLWQFIQARASRPKTVDIYSANQYAQSALQKLSQMKIDARPLVNEAILASRRGRYNAMQSGGLTAGQRLAANIAREGSYIDAISKIQRAVQEQNNAYASAYANAALAQGAEEAKQRQIANQYNEEYSARSHAARQHGMQTGLNNIYAQLQQIGANQFKRRMFNSQLGLFQQELDNKYGL